MFTNGLGRAVSRVLMGCLMVGISASAARAEEQASKHSPKVDALLKQMGAAMKSMAAFSFTAHISSDIVTPEGEKIENNRQTDFVVQRPGRMMGEVKGGAEMDRSFVYDGQQLTLLDHAAKVYSVTEVPGTIDEMLDFVYEKYGISVPTADFFYSDVYEVLTKDVQSSRYIGETLLDGQKCHQLAVRLSSIDYQIWIADGDKPLPLRMVLTYKEIEGAPQFRIEFSAWKGLEAAQVPAFKLEVPPTYSQVNLEANISEGITPDQQTEE